jgi:hypothetical protein
MAGASPPYQANQMQATLRNAADQVMDYVQDLEEDNQQLRHDKKVLQNKVQDLQYANGVLTHDLDHNSELAVQTSNILQAEKEVTVSCDMIINHCNFRLICTSIK